MTDLKQLTVQQRIEALLKQYEQKKKIFRTVPRDWNHANQIATAIALRVK